MFGYDTYLKRTSTLFVLIALFWASAFTMASANSAKQNKKLPLFVSAEWVYQHHNELKLIDLSSQQAYQKYHLPNAIWVNYNWLIKPQNGIALSGGTSYMTRILSELGIQPEDHIVIYDDMGNLDASRLYWELKKLNHAKVQLLDGGSVEWVLRGYPVTQHIPPRKPQSRYPMPKVDLTDALTADKKDVQAAIKDPNIILLDIRTQDEYSGHPKRNRSGHIPTAKWFDWTEAVDTENGFKQASSESLLKKLAELDITKAKQPIIIYCNSGHRAARSFTMLQSLGFENVKLYDASMQEYEVDQKLPLKLGYQP
ncbi:rhodanese-like domain-containing protein [Thiomicrorhabdus sp. zzn3]|uniref:sulfurtransferase n=1 Tax=Thiomicrorhabdus sp. zzn3 TaxID=3039775 RepID=UPI002437293E|nr:rhodanese-like domain-containing protein [Thiomicrorhabdus sp. zzn3]MDG6777838.1 rhodanese-like domain-containing protein [Thiomicrorhabdus sp. zzn3]